MLKINPEIIYTPGSVVTDQNASSKYAQFNEPADGLSVFNCKLVYAENWTDDDYFAYLKKVCVSPLSLSTPICAL